MMRIRLPGSCLLVGLAACSQTPISQPIRSLERSGDVSFVCAGPDRAGRPIEECPSADGSERHLLALVTQTRRGEVAVIDLSRGVVVDVDSTTPGYSFIPTGENPRGIVSTPGGVATFVAAGAAGREGIFGVPTSCTRSPARDLGAFPACALPSPPGAMALMIDPSDATGAVRASCAGAYAADQPEPLAASVDRECPADLRAETVPPGRRKLVVALPALGEVAVFDAQEVLDRAPGSFDPCVPERVLRLTVDLPAAPEAQVLPPDLVPEAGCINHPVATSATGSFPSRPAGFGTAPGRLFVADLDAPLVHQLDATSPCTLSELAPLLTASYDHPDRVIPTADVSVTPATTAGQRFAYAIDDTDGSLMVFDVSPGSTQRTPLVRAGSSELAFEAPDRIAFQSRVHDLDSVLHDVPIVDPITGVAPIGQRCDPNPDVDPDSSLAAFRTALDYGSGASPRKLRGVFTFAALASGQIAAIDVEDFDAACRRPTRANPSDVPDHRGCADGALAPEYFTETGASDGRRTVSGEVSCNVVQPHRVRAGSFQVVSSEVGIRAPALRTFPRFTDSESDGTPSEPGSTPRVLAVDYTATDPVDLWVGSNLYSHTADATNRLEVDPSLAEQSSVALVVKEPRAFAPQQDFALAYEGALVGERSTGAVRLNPAAGAWEMADPVRYCDYGVEDAALARDHGTRLGVPAADLAAFGVAHADYVQLTGGFLDSGASYWQSARCGGASPGDARAYCDQVFGPSDAPDEARELTILEAYTDRLVLAPRTVVVGSAAEQMELVACCFPNHTSYVVRASDEWILSGSGTGVAHDVTPDASTGRCVRDCDPRRHIDRSRAFEARLHQDGVADVGACTLTTLGPLAPDSPCVFQSRTHRFAIYAGGEPSHRGQVLSWTVTGGYVPLLSALSSGTVLPQRLVYVPVLSQLAVVDGAAAGLGFISLSSFSAGSLYF